MGFQVRGCGFISVTTAEGTSVTTAGQPQVVVFAVLTANPTTPRKITSVTEARINYGHTRIDLMVVRHSISRDCQVLIKRGKAEEKPSLISIRSRPGSNMLFIKPDTKIGGIK
jgi:hypothetical protein